MRKLISLMVVALFIASVAVCGQAQAAQKTMKGFKMKPMQKPVPVAKVQKSWAELSKGKTGVHLYTITDTSLVTGGMMKVMFKDETGLTHELVLTQPQWLGLTETIVETDKGMMFGAKEVGNEIEDFMSPMGH